MKTKLPHLPELDALRGLAALTVLIHHFMQRSTSPDGVLGWIVLRKFAAYGTLGVDVFFVLSGFLITCLLLIDRAKNSYFHNFYWKRVLRILPVYLAHIALASYIVPNIGIYILASMLFLMNFGSHFHPPTGGIPWTLSIEEQFYLLWPQAVRRLKLPSLYMVAFSLSALSLFARFFSPIVRHGLVITYTWYRFDGLALGSILAIQWFSSEPMSAWIQRVLGVLNSNITLGIVVVAQVLYFVFKSSDLLDASATITTANYLTYRLIRYIAFHRNPGRSWFAWLNTPVLTYLGGLSYAMYMYHVFPLAWVDRHLGQPDLAHPSTVAFQFFIVLAATLVMTVISRYALELPAQRLRRFIIRPQPASPHTAS